MSDWAVVTVVTRNYFHFARALAVSIRDIHPEARIIACVVDSLPASQAVNDEFFEVIPFEALQIPDAKRFLFQYAPFELTCALKSYVLEYVFRKTGLSRLLYLDGDIQVYSSLAPLLDSLQKNNVILTPHLTKPRSIEQLDQWEMDVLDTGVFNGGFIGLRNSDAALQMLVWWKRRMKQLCKWEINHVDQGWLSAVPTLFDGVKIERGSQYNSAVWNLETRHFSESALGQILVDGQPLVFFHFASIDPEQGQSLSKISRRPLIDEPTPIQKLFHQYVERLRGCGMAEYKALGYGYASLADGSAIQPEWREAIRTEHTVFCQTDDPFLVPANVFRQAVFGHKLKSQLRRVRRGLKF